MSCYVGLNVYNENSIKEITKYNIFSGAAIGDLFCQNRMFKNGKWDILSIAEELKSNNMKVIFQTPMYITSRNFEETISLINTLIRKKLLDKILVQDVGIVSYIGKNLPQVEMYWSRMGRNRTDQISAEFYEFLKTIKISGIENPFPNRTEHIKNLGLSVVNVLGNVDYKTFSRVCYTKYQLGLGSNCQEECLKGNLCLKNHDENLNMPINGYMLGGKLSYSDTDKYIGLHANSDLIVYSDNSCKLKDITAKYSNVIDRFRR